MLSLAQHDSGARYFNLPYLQPGLNLLVINLLNPHVVLLPAQVKPLEQRLLGH